MRRFFNPLSRSVAALAACTAIVLAASASEARSAIVPATGLQENLFRWQQTGMIFDWNGELIAQTISALDAEECPEVPALAPDDFQSLTPPMNDQIRRASDDRTAQAAPANVDASDDTMPRSGDSNGYSDYYRFKFGHSELPYAKNADMKDAAPMPTPDGAEAGNNDGDDANSRTDDCERESGKFDGGDSSADPSEDVMPSDDSRAESASHAAPNDNTANDDTANNDTANDGAARGSMLPENFNLDYLQCKFGELARYFGNLLNMNSNASQSTDATVATDGPSTGDDAAKSDENATDDASKTVDATKPDVATKNDEVAKSDDTNEGEQSSESDQNVKNDGGTAVENPDADVSQSMEKYYHYRYLPLEDRYGNDANRGGEVMPSEDSQPQDAQPASDEGDDSAAAGDESKENSVNRSSDDAAGSANRGDSPFANAMLAIAMRWTDELSTRWGVNALQVGRVLNWIY